MTRLTAFVAGAALFATVAAAETIAPQDVEYVDGAVETSLTGQPGDPEAGAVLMNKGRATASPAT